MQDWFSNDFISASESWDSERGDIRSLVLIFHTESEFWLAVGIFELVGEPVKTFIQAVTWSGTSGLDVPVSIPQWV